MAKTVLDIGGYNGWESHWYVEPEDRWIIVDNQQYKEYDGWKTVDSIPNAEYYVMDGLDWHEPADIVVCSNVIYHIPDPWKFLEHLYKLTKKKLIIRTYFDIGKGDWHFHDKDKNPGHPHAPTAATIFYRPTVNGLLKSLKKVGFKNIEVISAEGGIVKVECVKNEDI